MKIMMTKYFCQVIGVDDFNCKGSLFATTVVDDVGTWLDFDTSFFKRS